MVFTCASAIKCVITTLTLPVADGAHVLCAGSKACEAAGACLTVKHRWWAESGVGKERKLDGFQRSKDADQLKCGQATEKPGGN